jgi:N-methylhydantoinase B
MSRTGQLDPIGVSVIASGLIAVTEAMGAALIRGSFSPNIKERRDCSTAVFDAEGRLVAQAEHIPLHLGSMLGVVQAVLETHPLEALQQGDAFVANDPYLGGGTHLPDVTVVSPFFFENRLLGFAANIAHHADIGARAPGGISGDARSIEEEGLRLPPTRLATKRGLEQAVVELFASRCRMPEQRVLDLTGQVAANRVGLSELHLLFEKWGHASVLNAVEWWLEATARRLRAAVARLPDGAYEAEDEIEGLEEDGMIPVRALLRVQDDRLSLDFTGTGPPSIGAINVPFNALLATVYYAVKASLDPELPSNSGFHRAVQVTAPENSILNAQPPRAVGARTDTCQMVAGRIVEAFAKARPGSLPAPGNDASTAVVFSGLDPRSGEEYVYVEAIAGGAGGGPDADGPDGVQVHITNTSNLPVEALERTFPLRVERYEFVPDSGGPGRFRGGLGLRRDIRVVGHEATFSAHGDRHRRPARGAAGGIYGARGQYLLLESEGQSTRVLPAKTSDVKVSPNAVVSVRTPGGGGHGPPQQRERDGLAADVEAGLVSVESARTNYRSER